jgi:hypothetical protein
MSCVHGAGTVCVSVCLSWRGGTVRLFISIDVFKKTCKVREQSTLTTLSAVATCAQVRCDLRSYLCLVSNHSTIRKEIFQQNVQIDIRKLTVTSPFSKNRTEKRGNETLKSFTNTLWFCIKPLKCSVFLIPVSWWTLPYCIACRRNWQGFSSNYKGMCNYRYK